jgi:copper homeostasis protein
MASPFFRTAGSQLRYHEAVHHGLLLEVAVDSLERAVAAERGGAHRLELCRQLEVGGLTPGIELIRRVRAGVQIPIHVLVHPRAGNFGYSDEEFAQLKEELSAIREQNVQGIVTGALLADGSVDQKWTRELVTLALPLQVTFHRAFDETKDLEAALEAVVGSGAHRILTSGGAASAEQGALTLRRLVNQAGRRITILPGGGLHAGNIAEVAAATGAREFHTGLGDVILYNSDDSVAFESAVRDCVASLRT